MSPYCFLDTNVLLYLHDQVDARKRLIAQHLLSTLGRERSCVVSLQVLNEYYRVAISKAGSDRNRSTYRDNVRRFSRICNAPYGLDVMEMAWNLQEAANYSWWDLMILASAKRAGCRYLLTEDMADGHEFGGLTILNPFGADVISPFAKLGIAPAPNA